MAKKFFLFIILLFLTAPFCLADDGSTSYALSAVPDRKSARPGETIQLRITCQYPPERYFALWSVGAYRLTLPAAFQQKTGLVPKHIGTGAWDHFTIKKAWLKPAFYQARELTIEFPTDNWPLGDYALGCTVLLRETGKPDVKTDKYLTAKFYLTIDNIIP